MRILAISLLLFGCAAPRSHAEVALEIVSCPTEVFSFEPVYVLYSIRNTGSEALYLPAEHGPGRGPEIFVGIGDAEPSRETGLIVDHISPHATRTMWLAPGERWYFLEDVGRRARMLEGTMSIQAVFSSSGTCGDQLVGGRTTLSLNALRSESISVGDRIFDSFACWEGESRSLATRIVVRRGSSPEDREAEEALKRERKLVYNNEMGTWTLTRAWDAGKRFPKSHLGYAVLASGSASVLDKMKAVELQPGNALNPWVRGAIAKDALDYRSTCWRGQALELGVAIPELNVAPGFRDYLEQYDWALEHRLCPQRIREERLKAEN